MAERDFEQLDLAIGQLLAGTVVAGGEFDDLIEVASGLAFAPSPEFRARLKASLKVEEKQEEMEQITSYIRTGMHSVNPYLVVRNAEAFLDFLTKVFGAEVKFREPASGQVRHSETRVGDMTLEVADGNDIYPPSPAGLHIYTPDSDAAYARALEHGAKSLYEPFDTGYGDHEAGVRHESGVTIYISTRRGVESYKPQGLWDATAYMHVLGAGELIEFTKKVFGAEVTESAVNPDGTYAHAKVRIGDTTVELGDAHGEWGPMAANLHVYVPDVDATYQQALDAGATSQRRPEDTPYGDRSAGVVDKWGNQWWLATYTGA